MKLNKSKEITSDSNLKEILENYKFQQFLRYVAKSLAKSKLNKLEKKDLKAEEIIEIIKSLSQDELTSFLNIVNEFSKFFNFDKAQKQAYLYAIDFLFEEIKKTKKFGNLYNLENNFQKKLNDILEQHNNLENEILKILSYELPSTTPWNSLIIEIYEKNKINILKEFIKAKDNIGRTFFISKDREILRDYQGNLIIDILESQKFGKGYLIKYKNEKGETNFFYNIQGKITTITDNIKPYRIDSYCTETGNLKIFYPPLDIFKQELNSEVYLLQENLTDEVDIYYLLQKLTHYDLHLLSSDSKNFLIKDIEEIYNLYETFVIKAQISHKDNLDLIYPTALIWHTGKILKENIYSDKYFKEIGQTQEILGKKFLEVSYNEGINFSVDALVDKRGNLLKINGKTIFKIEKSNFLRKGKAIYHLNNDFFIEENELKKILENYISLDENDFSFEIYPTEDNNFSPISFYKEYFIKPQNEKEVISTKNLLEHLSSKQGGEKAIQLIKAILGIY